MDAVPGIVEEQRALATDGLQLVARRERRATVEGGEDIAGESQRPREDPIGAGGPEPGVAPDALRFAPEQPRPRDVVTADVHQGSALHVGAKPDVRLVVERVRERGADEPKLADSAVANELRELRRL